MSIDTERASERTSFVETKSRVETLYVVRGGEYTEEEVRQLVEELSDILNLAPRLVQRTCDSPYSHSPHAHGVNDQLYCSGRSFDRT